MLCPFPNSWHKKEIVHVLLILHYVIHKTLSLNSNDINTPDK